MPYIQLAYKHAPGAFTDQFPFFCKGYYFPQHSRASEPLGLSHSSQLGPLRLLPRCSIEGYQDTLYAHSLRQFYRDCNIYRTIDFIFSNGHIVIQNCKIIGREPLPYQKVTVTAQGRKEAEHNTGFSIHNSYVYGAYPMYLGRQWKLYSRTVLMQCYLGPQVQPAGWLEWAGNFALNTLFYGEYMNYGPI